MSKITHAEYWAEIESIAKEVTAEALENDLDTYEVLHEWIDGHQWVIYYSYNLDVLEHCSNMEAMIDNLGNESAGQVLAERGLLSLHSALAFWAMYEDVTNEDKFVINER